MLPQGTHDSLFDYKAKMTSSQDTEPEYRTLLHVILDSNNYCDYCDPLVDLGGQRWGVLCSCCCYVIIYCALFGVVCDHMISPCFDDKWLKCV